MLHWLALFATLLIETLVETYNKKIKKYCNNGNKEWERAKARATTGNTILQLIQDVVNDKTDKKDDRNISDHSASDSNSDSRRCHRHNDGGADGRVDELSIDTDTTDIDADGRTDPNT